MPFGSEYKFIHTSTFHRLLWTLRGDFHIGRWIRHFHLAKVLNKFPIRPSRILDAGCGTGQETFSLELRFASALIEGFDISAEYIEICKSIGKRLGSSATFCQADLQQLKFEEKYDLIVVNAVLYAIPDYQQALSNLMHSLSNGGWIIIQDMDIDCVRRRYGQNCKGVHDAVRMGFTLEELSPLFEQNKVAVVSAEKTVGIFGNLAHDLFTKFRAHSVLLNLLFPFLLFLGYLDTLMQTKEGSGVLLVGRKKPNPASGPLCAS